MGIFIGNVNAITYKGFFPLLKNGLVWADYSFNKTFEFIMPDSYALKGYDAVECSRVSDIPWDYFGPIGVPITFLDKHCPEQFEIIGISRELGRPMSEIAPKGTYEQGRVRFYLSNDKLAGMGRQFDENRGLKYRRLYDRIVIRRVR